MTADDAKDVDRADLHNWIERYERLWRTAGTDSLGELFTPDATYSVSPWAEPIRGVDAIGRMWEDERDGPDEGFTMSSDVVAVDGDLGVARIQVDYAERDALARPVADPARRRPALRRVRGMAHRAGRLSGYRKGASRAESAAATAAPDRTYSTAASISGDR